MIVIVKQGATKKSVEELKKELRQKGFDIHESQGTTTTILGLVGDTSSLTEDELLTYDAVEADRKSVV